MAKYELKYDIQCFSWNAYTSNMVDADHTGFVADVTKKSVLDQFQCPWL